MVEVQSHIEPIPIPAALVERAAALALAHDSTGGTLTVVLSDDAHVRELNREYLGIDEPTDVLSFPSDEKDPDTDQTYLGDVIISIPQARLQAQAAGHSIEAEIQLLIVHGVLHLLGHDHGDPPSKDRMWTAQGEVLRDLGLPGLAIGE